jgi:hypothetical protein
VFKRQASHSPPRWPSRRPHWRRRHDCHDDDDGRKAAGDGGPADAADGHAHQGAEIGHGRRDGRHRSWSTSRMPGQPSRGDVEPPAADSAPCSTRRRRPRRPSKVRRDPASTSSSRPPGGSGRSAASNAPSTPTRQRADGRDDGRRAETPPEATAMLQGVTMRIDGSIWSTTAGPGAAEYMAYAKAVDQEDVIGADGESMTGLAGGLDQMMSATARRRGSPT